MALVEVRSLKKSYPNAQDELVILDELDLTVEQGQIVSITGDSGSGKSTLLNLVAGLDEVSAGSVVSCGFEISRLGESDLTEYRKRHLGLVFQFHFLLKEFSAWENVFLPGWMATGRRTAMEERALELLKAVGMESRKDHYPGQLSGGERQRVALARALINDPPLILADEPTGNLDEANSRIVEDLIFRLAEEKGKTLVIVTHDRRLAARAQVHYHLAHRKLEVR